MFAALMVLTLGCATTPPTERDFALERECQDRAKAGTLHEGRWSNMCHTHTNDMVAKRAAAKAVEDDTRRERDCYVLLEDPKSTPQARGDCRYYIAQQAEKRAAAAQYGAAVVNGALAGQKK